MRYQATPLADLVELQRRVSRLFEEARAERSRLQGPSRLIPPMDVIEAEDAYVIVLDLPGIDADAVRVLVENGMLIVRGTKAPSEEGGRLVRRERQYGDFLRMFALPSDADVAGASAHLEDGVLRIRLSRRALRSRYEVPVTTG